jgi:hypothetical protein
LVRDHISVEREEGIEMVDPADAEVFLDSKTAGKHASADVLAQHEKQKRAAGGGDASVVSFDIERLDRKVLRWLVIEQQPFSGVESQSLQEAFKEANAAAHLKSRTTYHTMLLKAVEEEREKFKDLLGSHDGLFNLTCDAWSDIQQREFLGKTVYLYQICKGITSPQASQCIGLIMSSFSAPRFSSLSDSKGTRRGKT